MTAQVFAGQCRTRQHSLRGIPGGGSGAAGLGTACRAGDIRQGS